MQAVQAGVIKGSMGPLRVPLPPVCTWVMLELVPTRAEEAAFCDSHALGGALRLCV